MCVYSKSGLLSLQPRCPHTVPEPPLFLLSVKWAEDPACTLLGHDAFATRDEFLEERSMNFTAQ